MTQIDTSTEAIERLLEDVTPGPWSEHDAGKHPYFFVCGPDQLYYDGEVTDKPLVAYVTGVEAIENRAFIAAARDLVPALLKERDDMRAKLDEITDLLAEAASDLISYVFAEYPLENRMKYPEMERNCYRDLELVRRINVAITEIKEADQ